MAPRTIPDPAAEPTITVPRAAAVLDISRRHAYAAAERGEWPIIRVGRSVRIPTLRWLRTVGLVDEPDESALKADGESVTSTNAPPSHVDLTRQRRSSGSRGHQ